MDEFSPEFLFSEEALKPQEKFQWRAYAIQRHEVWIILPADIEGKDGLMIDGGFETAVDQAVHIMEYQEFVGELCEEE